MADTTLKRAVVVNNPQGLHLRSAELFVTLASRFQSRIEVVREQQRVDGKSILNLVTLAAVEGTHLSIEATGPDAEAALTALADLVDRNFDENGNSK
jgi:phosphotransferase system HPr (HPr) family protein